MTTFAIIPEAITGLVRLVDGYSTITHEMRADITEYPIETGSRIPDHAVFRPRKVKLEGWVSELTKGQGGAPSAWAEITDICQARRVVKLITPLINYDRMLITKATAPVDVTVGRSLRFEIELQEVLTVDSTISTGSSTPTSDRQTSVARGSVDTRDIL